LYKPAFVIKGLSSTGEVRCVLYTLFHLFEAEKTFCYWVFCCLFFGVFLSPFGLAGVSGGISRAGNRYNSDCKHEIDGQTVAMTDTERHRKDQILTLCTGGVGQGRGIPRHVPGRVGQVQKWLSFKSTLDLTIYTPKAGLGNHRAPTCSAQLSWDVLL
jgi:hypothetical protein